MKKELRFVDHPHVDPCEEDNPICVETCVVRARYRDDGHCFLTVMPTLRYAMSCGYTAKHHEAAYPTEWPDRRVSICCKGHAYLRLDRQGVFDPSPKEGKMAGKLGYGHRVEGLEPGNWSRAGRGDE